MQTTGPRNLITDVGGLTVGHAQDERLKSGSTVLWSDVPLAAGVHVMGGAPGTRETDLLRPDALVERIDAVVLSGGSAFGLGAAEGVAQALRDAGRGFPVGERRMPIVPAAILYDLDAGGDHGWERSPYPDLGTRAVAARTADFALGSVGAGTGAVAGPFKGGIGSASTLLEDGTIVGALVAANPVGGVCDPDTGAYWAAPFEVGDEFGSLGSPERAVLTTKLARPGEATTIAVIATDAALSKAQATRVAIAAHDGMARAIVPSHTPFDGDLVFAVSTRARTTPDPMGLAMLGHAAAVCLARAIARAVHQARPAPGDAAPCHADRFGRGTRAD